MVENVYGDSLSVFSEKRNDVFLSWWERVKTTRETMFTVIFFILTGETSHSIVL